MKVINFILYYMYTNQFKIFFACYYIFISQVNSYIIESKGININKN